MFDTYLKSYQQRFNTCVLPECKALLAQSPEGWSAEVDGTLDMISRGGKRLRSAFFAYVLEKTDFPRSQTFEALLELFHVALLIHDDIVDHADFRRGKKSFHKHIESMDRALIWGDYLFSLTMNQFAKHPRVSRVFTNAFLSTCVGQLQDLSLRGGTSSEDILDCYANKTGVYGFYLPLALALTLADISFDDNTLLEVSRKGGMLYQIADDLSLFDPHQDNKSAHSDYDLGQLTYVLAVIKNNIPEISHTTFSDWISKVRSHPLLPACLSVIHKEMEHLAHKMKSIDLNISSTGGKQAVDDLLKYICTYTLNKCDVRCTLKFKQA